MLASLEARRATRSAREKESPQNTLSTQKIQRLWVCGLCELRGELHVFTTASVALMMASMSAGAQQPLSEMPKSPVVLVVGCASPSAQPHIWTLSHATERTVSSRPVIATDEREPLAKRPLGQHTYQLIGVSDFVDAATSRTIGVRGEILPLSRVNTTGSLAHGHKVAVKGLYIDGRPARINLTSVVDLGASCP